MASSNGTTLSTVEGVVRSANTHGVKLEGEQDWRNYSKFAKPEELHTPAVGAHVILTLDKAGFVRKVDEAAPTPQADAAQPTASGAQVGERDKLIVRQSSLKAAVEILASGGKEVDVAEVMDLAEVLEQWVCRAA